MDIQLLRTFIEVSKTRHFGHAADNLYLTQSAVSFRIRQLETQLGAPLFIRQRGNVRLTSAGERMLPYAETLLQTWQRAQQDVTLTQAANEQLTIGASPTLWELEGVSDWINRICANQPDWVIRAEATPRQMLARQLIEKRIDAGLTSELPKLEGLHSHHLGDYQLQLVSHLPDVTMADIQDLAIVYLDWGTRFAVEQSRIEALQRPPVLHTQSCHLALNYLLTHGGVAFLPSLAIQPYIDRGQLHLVGTSPALVHQLYLVWLDGSDKSHLINELQSSTGQLVPE
ncbi:MULTISPECIES: HTH-type transcriptional regulator HdfR [Salinivibrio]|uniref:HTH-type transcriptional regulator HdfR n=2 Tax=Salinivibrio TaxID=51366 RepID=A0ABY7LLL6_9GAMM|nr:MULTISPECIES: HTH-type transcriptional regulator HdfR [Salinivibrio]ODQ01484.1 transcriptional regulator [Salinivibrio sp. DV]QIR07818.1 HTH-type transcriptional regulator HdfR [Salinivibrio costicola]WBA16538.1 HTH-type transcriptional regulator HdfR [Salinivibrio proteolyticus]